VTSTELSDICSKPILSDGKKIILEESQVFAAAMMAQKDILRELRLLEGNGSVGLVSGQT